MQHHYALGTMQEGFHTFEVTEYNAESVNPTVGKVWAPGCILCFAALIKF